MGRDTNMVRRQILWVCHKSPDLMYEQEVNRKEDAMIDRDSPAGSGKIKQTAQKAIYSPNAV